MSLFNHNHWFDTTGKVPPDLSRLRKLTKLSLISNKSLTGILPQEILELPHLFSISVLSTNISGFFDLEIINLNE